MPRKRAREEVESSLDDNEPEDDDVHDDDDDDENGGGDINIPNGKLTHEFDHDEGESENGNSEDENEQSEDGSVREDDDEDDEDDNNEEDDDNNRDDISQSSSLASEEEDDEDESGSPSSSDSENGRRKRRRGSSSRRTMHNNAASSSVGVTSNGKAGPLTGGKVGTMGGGGGGKIPPPVGSMGGVAGTHKVQEKRVFKDLDPWTSIPLLRGSNSSVETKKSYNIPAPPAAQQVVPTYSEMVPKGFAPPMAYIRHRPTILASATTSTTNGTTTDAATTAPAPTTNGTTTIYPLEYEYTDEDIAWVQSKANKWLAPPMDVIERILNAFEFRTAFGSPILPSTANHIVQAMALQPPLPAKCVEDIHKYWMDKRGRFRKPLLRRFWPNTPVEDTNPSLTFRPREKERYRLRKKRVNDVESFEKLLCLKSDFEKIKDLIEIVRRYASHTHAPVFTILTPTCRREITKKLHADLLFVDYQERLRLARAGSPLPRASCLDEKIPVMVDPIVFEPPVVVGGDAARRAQLEKQQQLAMLQQQQQHQHSSSNRFSSGGGGGGDGHRHKKKIRSSMSTEREYDRHHHRGQSHRRGTLPDSEQLDIIPADGGGDQDLHLPPLAQSIPFFLLDVHNKDEDIAPVTLTQRTRQAFRPSQAQNLLSKVVKRVRHARWPELFLDEVMRSRIRRSSMSTTPILVRPRVGRLGRLFLDRIPTSSSTSTKTPFDISFAPKLSCSEMQSIVHDTQLHPFEAQTDFNERFDHVMRGGEWDMSVSPVPSPPPLASAPGMPPPHSEDEVVLAKLDEFVLNRAEPDIGTRPRFRLFL